MSYSDIKLYGNSDINSNFILRISASDGDATDKISDRISSKLCTELGLDEYRVICDIVKTRAPGGIFIDNTGNEPDDLQNKSDIIKAIKQRNSMRIYVDPDSKSKVPQKLLLFSLKKVMEMETDR